MTRLDKLSPMTAVDSHINEQGDLSRQRSEDIESKDRMLHSVASPAEEDSANSQDTHDGKGQSQVCTQMIARILL